MVYSEYDAYQQGVKDDLFIKDISGGYYLGQVWPGPTYFPDFFHPKSQDYWTNQLKTFHDKVVAVDGLWIDMNEVPLLFLLRFRFLYNNFMLDLQFL
jgi:alpha-glucosidase (family GH31 glycosyl hydrolase)